MPEASPYDPVAYWNNRDDPNRKGQVDLDRGSRIWRYLERHIRRGMSIFELGPGKGRLFPVFRGHSLATLDISRNYCSQIEGAARANDIELDAHFSDDPDADWPFADGAFDLAIACQVTIHIPFETIEHTLSELGRVGRKAVVIAGHDVRWPSGPGAPSPVRHCFNHEYFAMLSHLGFTVEDVEIYPNAKHFAFRRMD